MKVILLKDVPKVGVRHQVKDLKDGFAQNVLIAKGLAIMATPKALADLEKKKLEMNNKKENELQAFESIISIINNKKINIKTKANEKGHLFKAVSPKDVSSAIWKITGIQIDEEGIVMENIKELGKYTIEIKKGNKKGNCEVVVEKE